MRETRDLLSLFRDALGILPPGGRERGRGRATGVCALRPLGETVPVRGLWSRDLWLMSSPSLRLACGFRLDDASPWDHGTASIGFSILFILCVFTGSCTDAECK